MSQKKIQKLLKKPKQTITKYLKKIDLTYAVVLVLIFVIVVGVGQVLVPLEDPADTTGEEATGNEPDYYQLSFTFEEDVEWEYLLAIADGDSYPDEPFQIIIYFIGIPEIIETVTFYLDGNTYYSVFDYPQYYIRTEEFEGVMLTFESDYLAFEAILEDTPEGDFAFGLGDSVMPMSLGGTEHYEMFEWYDEYGAYASTLEDYVFVESIKDGSGNRFDPIGFLEG